MSTTISVPHPTLTFKRTEAEQAHELLWNRFGKKDPRWAHALEKAWVHLAYSSGWQWNGEQLLARSDHYEGQRYIATIHRCDCHAGVKGWVCWHAAACHLLTTAAQLAQAPNN